MTSCILAPPGQVRTRLDAAASAFDNSYTVALAITASALAAGSAFAYRYLADRRTRLALGVRRRAAGEHAC